LSRIGKLPIPIPEGIEIEQQGNTIHVKGKNGNLFENIHPDMKIIMEDNSLRIERPTESKLHRSLHGLSRSLVQNMIIGLTSGFQKNLDIIGVGYRAELKGKNLVLQLGYSHPIYFKPPDKITIVTPNPNKIIITGIDKQLVGQVAAKIRSFRPPEPYKGKGIRYENETVKKKAGKTAA
jgi:large subunit ribosomal protein L6